MEIKGKLVTLKMMTHQDIEDSILWFTQDTEWMNWDAPWEKGEPFDSEDYRKRKKLLIETRNIGDFEPRLEIYYENIHIGWMNRYFINESFEYDSKGKQIAIGIVIVHAKYRHIGLGYDAYMAYMNFIKELGYTRVYTQTWSGNVPMVNLAHKTGFHLINRIKDCRMVDGVSYDALTYVKALD
ncbi:MAG: GNAT family N-acetyltransferase [Firmicutes bacterium]|nr:GNAT family N-acetyltransferase [Bacillota bacterium]